MITKEIQNFLEHANRKGLDFTEDNVDSITKTVTEYETRFEIWLSKGHRKIKFSKTIKTENMG